jgi:2OG-Fe(II) oxygenase superfamily
MMATVQYSTRRTTTARFHSLGCLLFVLLAMIAAWSGIRTQCDAWMLPPPSSSSPRSTATTSTSLLRIINNINRILTPPSPPNNGKIRPFPSSSSSYNDFNDLGYDLDYDVDDDVYNAPHDIHWLPRPSTTSSNSNDLFYDDVLDETDSASSSPSESSLGKSIGQGQAVVCIPNVATDDESNALFAAALQAAAAGSSTSGGGRSRFSVSDPKAFTNDVVLMCDEILLRVLDHVDRHIPSIYRELFVPSPDVSDAERLWLQNQPLNAQLEQVTTPPPLDVLQQTTDGLRDLYLQSELEWSEGEPAINVYEVGGQFGAHKDHLALTVLIPLTDAETFEGGGTGFWGGNRAVDENQRNSQPDIVLTPPKGSALLFGGDVTHSGMPVTSGLRSVFVCSFSTKTPASSPDRLHGMQAPPQVSPSFSKGTSM